MGCDNSSEVMVHPEHNQNNSQKVEIIIIEQGITHQSPASFPNGALFRITGSDSCPYNNRVWTISEFLLGVTPGGLIVGKMKYHGDKIYPIMGRWSQSDIMFRMPYQNSDSEEMDIYQYFGQANFSRNVLQGEWHSQDHPENLSHQGYFHYQFCNLALEPYLVPVGQFKIVGIEINEVGKIWATPNVQISSSSPGEFKGFADYSNQADGDVQSQFIGYHVDGSLFSFQLIYGEHVYQYLGMRYQYQIFGTWRSKSQPENQGKRGTFIWTIQLNQDN